MNTELNQEVAHVLLQMVIKSLMRKPQVLMLNELVQSTLQKGTTVEELIQPTHNEAEVEVHWQDGPNAKENVEDNIDESTPQKRVEAEAEEGRDYWQDGPIQK